MAHALIIDDNKDNVGILEQMLEMEGVSYTSMNDPAKFETKMADVGKIDVVFLDLEMPNMDGYQMLGKLKADARFNGVPIIGYTVHVSEMSVARQKGFDGFLGKPLDADSFPEHLKRILSGQSVWANP